MAITPAARAPGNAYVGTSGFAYPEWAPLFYPQRTKGDALLREYASRLPAVELNNTFYQQPKPDRVDAWLAATPDDFRFVVKAQRGGSMRAFGTAAQETVGWLTAPYRRFASRLASVLYRIPEQIRRDDTRLRQLLDAWPADLPLTVEFQHHSWHTDDVYAILADHKAALCATDLDHGDPPDIRRTGNHVYLRLRRTAYSDDELAAWADRMAPFLADGSDGYCFFRHDEDGASAVRASNFLTLLTKRAG